MVLLGNEVSEEQVLASELEDRLELGEGVGKSVSESVDEVEEEEEESVEEECGGEMDCVGWRLGLDWVDLGLGFSCVRKG